MEISKLSIEVFLLNQQPLTPAKIQEIWQTILTFKLLQINSTSRTFFLSYSFILYLIKKSHLQL